MSPSPVLQQGEISGLLLPTDASGHQRSAPLRFILFAFVAAVVVAKGAASSYIPQPIVSPAKGQPPLISPATGHVNRIYKWRSQKIRYQVVGENNPGQSVILVHGMFSNCDHWRHTLGDLSGAGCRVFALDLLGFGYSSKPKPSDRDTTNFLNGENRFELDSTASGLPKSTPSVLRDVQLGTATGGVRTRDISLRHPLGSPYNFYTWAEQLEDFARNVVLDADRNGQKACLVGNSIGSVAALQAAMDCPDLFNGVFVLTPTFRSKHHAEVPFEWLSMPILHAFQRFLRTKGNNLYERLAKPSIVKKLLQKPYAVSSAVDDELVDSLLTPLRLPGASDVILDILSYSAGPLPEQQLAMFPSKDVPVWIAYGTADPWTPGPRVESMAKFDNVERVIPLVGVGHCPQDEAPEVVNPMLLEFFERVVNS